MTLDATDRRIVEATQAGLPLAPRPYAAVAEALGLGEAEVIEPAGGDAGAGRGARASPPPRTTTRSG